MIVIAFSKALHKTNMRTWLRRERLRDSPLVLINPLVSRICEEMLFTNMRTTTAR
jgi:hypothetical protein